MTRATTIPPERELERIEGRLDKLEESGARNTHTLIAVCGLDGSNGKLGRARQDIEATRESLGELREELAAERQRREDDFRGLRRFAWSLLLALILSWGAGIWQTCRAQVQRDTEWKFRFEALEEWKGVVEQWRRTLDDRRHTSTTL